MFNRICNELKSFLTPLSISISCTDVFEETLLKLATVETHPKRCQFANSKSQWVLSPSETRMYFRIWGITTEEAEKFLNFFKVTHGDTNATVSYNPPPKAPNPEDGEDAMVLFIPEDVPDFDSHLFDVDAAIVLNKILPLFKDEITRLQKETPEALVGYQQKSKSVFERSESESVKRYYLPNSSAPVAAPEPAKPSMLGSVFNFFKSYLNTNSTSYNNDSEEEMSEEENSDRFII